jgi:AbrB family looped-hinge helix DNA binding protein
MFYFFDKVKQRWFMSTSTLSKKYQIVIPQVVRTQLGLRRGMKVYLESIDEDRAILTKRPESYVDALDGLGADIWKKLGGGDNYIKRERASWGDR